MAVHVARGGADVVGGDDPTPVAGETAQDQDDAQPRQLVVIEIDGRAAQGLEDAVERVGMDRGREPVPDRGGPDGQPGPRAPRVRRQVIRQLRDQQDGVVGADRAIRPRQRRGCRAR